jgi:glycosyltransferase involved in cell wall biosynthesis
VRTEVRGFEAASTTDVDLPFGFGRQLRIAVVSTGTLRGSGFATRVCSMLEAYADAGHEVDLFHPRFPVEEAPPDSVIRKLRAYHTTVIPHGDERINHLHLYPPLMRAVDRTGKRWDALRDGRGYDLVQCESINVWSLGKRLRGGKRLLVFHDDDWVRVHRVARHAPDRLRRMTRELSALKYRVLQWRFAAGVDACWFVSRVEMERALRARPDIAAGIVPNGASDPYFAVPHTADSTPPVAAFVGPTVNMSNLDGADWLVNEVWPEVVASVPDARLRLVGRGWDKIYAPGSRPWLETTGFVEDLAEEIAKARVALAPLRSGGGTKLKVIEAMAAARPVVSTSVGAEAIPASRGLIVADTTDGFVRSLVRWFEDRNDAARSGLENRAAVEHLRWRSIWVGALRQIDRLTANTRPSRDTA